MGEKLKGDFRKFMDKSFLGAWDIPDDGDLVLTIDHVAIDEVQNDRGREKKMTLHFVERNYKPMICNTTNAKAISKAYGSTKVEDWENRPIALYKATISAFGQTTECLRVREYAPKMETYTCQDCGKTIVEVDGFNPSVIVQRSRKRFGRDLCLSCGRKAAEEQA